MKVKWTMRGETDLEVEKYAVFLTEEVFEREISNLAPRDFARDAQYIDFEIPNMGTMSIILKDIKWNKEG